MPRELAYCFKESHWRKNSNCQYLCAAIESVMYLGFPEVFGQRMLIIASHALVIVLYATFRIVLYLEKRRLTLAER